MLAKNGGTNQIWNLVNVSDQFNQNTYYIRNGATGRYLQATPNQAAVSTVTLNSKTDYSLLKWQRIGNKFMNIKTGKYLSAPNNFIGAYDTGEDWILE